ncbi:related to COG5 - conserved oligomeric golgi complex [Cephalotrichum gorgonifer]|uniref:Conserved oligomeric Golgi complex subunit 5 n=1 Tax=Cephalotrichum gorgonifer TaxID=2041049 RepID=A0AAE8N2A3_9PEZI|nr:related to COG5 - conserved oligomeric golgi complex [Cephalotrichum gorgonifer]
MAADEEPSYIDYDTFLDPNFNPRAFANSLVLLTNNANDLPLDLSTPLSRVLFDIQEIDSHIDLVTTRSAVPLLEYTAEQNASSTRVVSELDAHIKSLNDSYRQLEKEVVDKHAEAEEVRVVASRLWETLRLGRSVSRCLQLGRQLEVQHAEISGSSSGAGGSRKDDHRALVRCSHTILSLREILERNKPGEEGFGLEKVDAVRSLREAVIGPIERSLRESSERIIREFNVPATATFAHVEEAKARLVSALVTLYLLSPTSANPDKPDKWSPRLLLQALETYLRTSLQGSTSTLARALAQLPTLERAVADVSAKCQNIIALEIVLDSTKAPVHPLVASTAAGGEQKQQSLLRPLLAHLETGSLASYFWRSLAGSMTTRVQEISNRGGAVARTLKTNRASVGEAIRECVVRGGTLPSALVSAKSKRRNPEDVKWDREIAVMIGSVVNNLGR